MQEISKDSRARLSPELDVSPITSSPSMFTFEQHYDVSARLSIKERLRKCTHPDSDDEHISGPAGIIHCSDTEDDSEIPVLRKSSSGSKLSTLANRFRRTTIRDHFSTQSLDRNLSPPVDSPPSLFSSLRTSASTIFLKRTDSAISLEEKYGKLDKLSLGKGANGIVRLAHKEILSTEFGPTERFYAVKEFRRRHDCGESKKEYIKKVTSEFCISSSLDHQRIIKTLDLIQNSKQAWCLVLEFCPGGDLCSMIQSSTSITPDSADCYMVQLLDGVSYIHSRGVAHRDLKPENIMLNSHGFLKITDFGESEVFRSPYSNTCLKSVKCVGSEPYMAPEEFHQHVALIPSSTSDIPCICDANQVPEFDPQLVDLWACGVIYLAMIHSRIPWMKPVANSDPHYKFYLNTRVHACGDGAGFELVDSLPPPARYMISSILDPNPITRSTVNDILSSEWYNISHVSEQECTRMGSLERDFYNGALDVGSCSNGFCNGSVGIPSMTPAERHHLRHHPLAPLQT